MIILINKKIFLTMEAKRGLFIVIEGIEQSKFDEILKGVSGKFSKVKVLKLFNQKSRSIPQDISIRIKQMEEQSPKLATRASFMAKAMERWERRKEMIDAIKYYQLILIPDYCFNDIMTTFTREDEVKWAKILFTGLPRPDKVFYCTQDSKRYKTLFKDAFLKEITSTEPLHQIEEIAKGITDIQVLYSKHKTEDCDLIKNDSNLNFYPFSIGEDLFL